MIGIARYGILGYARLTGVNYKMANKLVVPEAKEAMNRFKMEAATDVDVPPTY